VNIELNPNTPFWLSSKLPCEWDSTYMYVDAYTSIYKCIYIYKKVYIDTHTSARGVRHLELSIYIYIHIYMYAHTSERKYTGKAY